MDFRITTMQNSDWEQVAEIFKQGIRTGLATFQTEAPTWEQWDEGHIKACRLVAVDGGTVLGWCALSPTSSKSYYAGVVEVSIYISEKHKGVGVGTALLNSLIDESERNGFWTLYSGIIADNKASLGLHKKCGFREIGFREKVGRMQGKRWMDVVMMERRSRIVGVEE